MKEGSTAAVWIEPGRQRRAGEAQVREKMTTRRTELGAAHGLAPCSSLVAHTLAAAVATYMPGTAAQTDSLAEAYIGPEALAEIRM